MPSPGFPTLFVSHGAPTILDERDGAAAFLRNLGRQLGRPRAILCVTAHWQTAVPTVGSAPAPTTVHDFHGFAPHLYDLTYPAPGAVGLAADVIAALRNAGLPHAVDHQRGFDHATWVPLMLMYPDANVPVAQLSVQPQADAAHHLAVGRALAALRRSGILIMGSGASVHNLSQYRSGDDEVPDWAATFQAWLVDAVCRGAVDEIVAYRQDRADGSMAHPRDEHLMPLLVAMGAAGGAPGRVLFEGFQGALGLAAFAFESAVPDSQDVGIQRRSRLRRDERERMIVDEAIRFFAEAGIDGQTRALADRLGITQPLLYRYFPDKEALLARVFDEIFARRWRPEWETELSDRRQPLEERVRTFAAGYTRAFCQDGWVRLLVSAGLHDATFDDRILEAVRRHVVLPLAAELRHDAGLSGQPGEREFELAWSLHASLVFLAMRKWLHNMTVPADLDALCDTLAASFVAGAKAALSRQGAKQPAE